MNLFYEIKTLYIYIQMFCDYFEIFLIYASYQLCLIDYSRMLQKIILKLSTMSILFIKMFQWFSYDFTNKICDNVEKEELDIFLKNCLNKVDFNEDEIDREELEKLIQNIKQDNKTLEIEEFPSNSGTIALAFKGKLDNKDVIIKLLRKDILHKINEDLNNIDSIGKFFSNTYFFSNFKEIPDFFIFNKESILRQTNFNYEIDNTKFFDEKFKNATSIVIPNLYYNYSNEKLIMMDYIENINKDIDNLTREENEYFLLLILKFYYNSIVLKKTIHCDLHLGNLLFIKNKNNETNKIDYKLGVIDYGICLKIDIKEQNFLDKAFMDSMLNFDLYKIIEEVMNHIKDKYGHDNNHENILNEIKNYINENILEEKKMLSHYDVYTFVKISKKYNLVIPERVYNMLLSFVSLMGTLNKFVSIFKNTDEKNEFLKKNIF